MNWNGPSKRWPNHADVVTADQQDAKNITAITGDKSNPNRSNELINTKLNLLLELLYLVLFVRVGSAYRMNEISNVMYVSGEKKVILQMLDVVKNSMNYFLKLTKYTR